MTELANRIRAARGYAGLSRPALVAKMGQGSKETLGRVERGERIADDKLDAIARACGLPYAFFTVDFARLPELAEQAEAEATPAPASADELARLQAKVDLLAGQVAALAAAALPPSGAAPGSIEGLRGGRLQ